ncbi:MULTISPECIES: hypothetical protein [Halomonas]|uniref:hypothetical protein n=1 Tax=Halomonas TaxID=2745 RepID=UPI001A8D30A8|nr:MULTISPECIES: hypothetical protein [Halomonas]MED5296839.1 hypothetical protein [Pseudomonadota bacterium]MBN8410873.1 hypothetical protein [Halomonas litopenaei]MBY5925540.1 hypothetical protein [Halomonas sp. DP4Y7-2]MBY6030735.1 hypothetical protein [Halomonas sp. DP8Y7-1]MBY6208107.1 hypothetical protein [Halomonas sp. DP3Y7-2]
MTRRKKTRSLADKVTIRTGRRKDYKQWRHENPDEVTSSRRFSAKKKQQRKNQAAKRLERMRAAPNIEIHPSRPDTPDSDAGKGDS